jgi:hypothetical protein
VGGEDGRVLVVFASRAYIEHVAGHGGLCRRSVYTIRSCVNSIA